MKTNLHLLQIEKNVEAEGCHLLLNLPPRSYIITTLKVSPSGRNRTKHEENGSLLQIFRIPTTVREISRSGAEK